MCWMATSAVQRRRITCGDTTERMLRRDLLALPFALQAQNALFLTGTPDLPSTPPELKAGPLSLIFEPGLGFVRYIRFGEHEVLRGIYAAVRDKSWGTVAPKVSNLKTVTTPDGFVSSGPITAVSPPVDSSAALVPPCRGRV